MNNLEKETMEMAKRAARKYVYDEIDWEQRRYEIAKTLLPTAYNLFYSNNEYHELVWALVDKEHPELLRIISELVLEQTDEFIKELKGGKLCE